ncbi:hypothetical protein SAMN05444008_11552 [Cnuella takakiae]|uniref:Uncharacterized protein n=1 Tax=Cnuella takakiae TaxID=1302690 RepID=A0A1M5G1J7_9BACT|nr:hypothetical protein [Cnuella takakiae]OLY92286.1 hypothetical protein BUE76_10570 [Cnuella takakiae]SHF97312.1 hypothetical protein SAMN05444008_11552 [Cnuella takakiae]
MMAIQINDEVFLNTNVFDDATRWRNHHIYKRILEESRLGIVQGWVKQHNQWWVKFPGVTIRVEERNLIKVEAEAD